MTLPAIKVQCREVDTHGVCRLRIWSSEYIDVAKVCHAFGLTPEQLFARVRNRPLPTLFDLPGGEPPDADTPFERFWRAWPSHKRKGAKPYCQRIWNRKSLDSVADTVLAALEAFKKLDDWQSGKFVPMPSTWLTQDRWDCDLADLQRAPAAESVAERLQRIGGNDAQG